MFRLMVYNNHEKGDFVAEWTLPALENYIVGNMIYHTRNYIYWYSKYDEIKHLYYVISWRKKRGLISCGRSCERIINDVLVILDG